VRARARAREQLNLPADSTDKVPEIPYKDELFFEM
jgi:hypothetical protein